MSARKRYLMAGLMVVVAAICATLVVVFTHPKPPEPSWVKWAPAVAFFPLTAAAIALSIDP
jgi:peptidoglycan/LPS O-acetylase OafA/YrhL